MKTSRAFALAIAIVLLPRIGSAAELVMFESELCEWCETWHAEIGGVYAKTSEGMAAPLRRIDIDAPRSGKLKSIRGIIYTPTFVLLHQGKEVGRINGYPGESHFWGLLDQLIVRSVQPVKGCPSPSESAGLPGPNSNGNMAC